MKKSSFNCRRLANSGRSLEKMPEVPILGVRNSPVTKMCKFYGLMQPLCYFNNYRQRRAPSDLHDVNVA